MDRFAVLHEHIARLTDHPGQAASLSRLTSLFLEAYGDELFPDDNMIVHDETGLKVRWRTSTAEYHPEAEDSAVQNSGLPVRLFFASMFAKIADDYRQLIDELKKRDKTLRVFMVLAIKGVVIDEIDFDLVMTFQYGYVEA